MKVFISSFCCLFVLVGTCLTPAFKGWFYQSGLMPVTYVSATQVHEMRQRPMAASLLSYEIAVKQKESCLIAYRKAASMDTSLPDPDDCQGVVK